MGWTMTDDVVRYTSFVFKDRFANIDKIELMKLIENKTGVKFYTEEVVPLKHQLVGLYWLLDRVGNPIKVNGGGLWFRMGLGKTKTAIDFIRMSKIRNRILIVGLKSTLYGWLEEWRRNAPEYRVMIVEGNIKEKQKILRRDDVDVWLMNYESLWKRQGAVKSKMRRPGTFDTVEKLLLDVQKIIIPELDREWNIIVFDESRSISHLNSLRTRVSLYLAKKAKYRLLLAGVPVLKNLNEAFPQQWCIDFGQVFGQKPKLFEMRVYEKDWKLAARKGQYYPVLVKKPGADEYVSLGLHLAGITYTKEECLDLPQKLIQDRMVELRGDQLKAYVKMKHEGNLNLNEIVDTGNFTRLVAVLKRFMQITGGWLKVSGSIVEFKHNAKMDELFNVLEEIGNEKVVIVANFVAEQVGIVDALEKRLNEKVARIVGGMTASEINKNIKWFNFDDSVKYIVVSPRVGGRGINLARSRYCLMYSLDFDTETYWQMEDRLHRMPDPEVLKKYPFLNNVKAVNYIRLVAKDTIDEKVLSVIHRDKKTVKQIFEKGVKVKDII